MEDPGDDRLSRVSTIMGPAGLTAVFGMGTGVAPPVWSPGKRAAGDAPDARVEFAMWQESCSSRRGIEHDPPPRRTRAIVSISLLGSSGSHRRPGCAEMRGCIAASGRGGQAARLLGPVGCDPRGPCTPGLSTWSSSRSLQYDCTRKPGLGGGFALRCLQRLSGPDLATRRCPERDSRHTRGRSSPILSY